MEIKIEDVDKVLPDTPTVDITKTTYEKGSTHPIIINIENNSFMGVTNSSGKLLLT